MHSSTIAHETSPSVIERALHDDEDDLEALGRIGSLHDLDGEIQEGGFA